jgi:TRAP-type C4-dicarboxylate transport system permease small subunit
VTEDKINPGWLDRAEQAGRLVENTVLVVVLSGMILLASGQILLRNVFDSGLPWADEALRLMVLWLAMFGAVAASREDRHISIDALARVLPETGRLWAAAAVNAFTAAVTLGIAWYSWLFLADSIEFGDVLLGELPAWLFQSVMPIAFSLIGYRYVIWCARRIRKIISGAGRR